LVTSIPIEVPAFEGPQPELALRYSSRAGNGPVGVGWGLDADSTIRRVSAGGGSPRFDSDDRFELDGRELIPCRTDTTGPSCAAGGTHAFAAESFQRVALVGNSWEVTDTDGTTTIYTALPNGGAPGTLAWMRSVVTDTSNRAVIFERWCDGPSACYPRRVRYAPGTACKDDIPDIPEGTKLEGAAIQFDWEARPDVLEQRNAGATFTTRFRLKTIEVSHAGVLLRAYALSYATNAQGGASVLTRVEQYGSDAVIGPDGSVLSGSRLPAQTFLTSVGDALAIAEPATLPAGQTLVHATAGPIALPPLWTNTPLPAETSTVGSGFLMADVDGDRLPDAVSWGLDPTCTTLTIHTRLRAETTYSTEQLAWPAGSGRCANVTAQAPELNGDGRADLLFVSYVDMDPDIVFVQPQTDLVSVLRRIGGGWEIPDGAQWTGIMHPPHRRSECEAADVDGNGLADYACLAPDALGLGWDLVLAQNAGGGRFVTSRSTAPVGHDHHLQMFDVDGDRRDDAVVVENHSQADAAVACTGLCPHWALHVGRSRGSAFPVWEHQETQEFSTLGPPWHETTVLDGDFDGDGRRDLLIQVSGVHTRFTVALNRNRESIRWTLRGQDVLNYTGSTSVGDVDRDGDTDLLLAVGHAGHAANACGPEITSLHTVLVTGLADGNGGFALPADVNSGCPGVETTWPWSSPTGKEHNARATDINADGAVDWVTEWRDGDFWLITASATPNAAPPPAAARSGDVDGDGRPDWVSVGFLNPGIEVFLEMANADGTLTPRHAIFAPTALGESAAPTSVRDWFLADVGSVGGGPDGKDDIIVVDSTTNVVTTLLARGDGGWVPRVRRHWLPTDEQVPTWRIMDLDGDGAGDLVHVEQVDFGNGGGALVRVSSLRANGDGDWLEMSDYNFQGAADDPSAWRFIALDVDGDHRADLVHVAFDFESDDGNNTNVRVLRSRGDGTFDDFQQRLVQPRIDANRYVPVDANGDGRQDLALVEASPGQGAAVSWLVSRGDGTFEPQSRAITGTLANALDDHGELHFTDLDRDGRTDLVFLSFAPTGPLWAVVGWNRGEISPQLLPAMASTIRDTDRLALVDIDADGDLDVVHVGAALTRWTLEVPDMRIASELSELGGRTDVTYTSSAGMHTAMPSGFVVPVVSRVDVFDGRSTSAVDTVRYRYRGATYDFAGHDFLGFRLRDVERQRSLTVESYDLDATCRVRLVATELHDRNGRMLTRSTFGTMISTGPGPELCLMDREQHWECEGESKCRTTGLRFYYDIYGNQTWTIDQGDVFDPSDDRLGESTFAPNLATYVLDRPAQTSTSEAVQTPSGWDWRVLEAKRFLYDDHGDYLDPPERGRVTSTLLWDDVLGDFLVRTFAYDNFGNVERVTGPPTPHAPDGELQTTRYDCTFHRFPVQQCDALHCSTTDWDLAHARVERVIDLNGQIVATEYDPNGRLVRVDMPGGRFTRTVFPTPSTWGTPGQAIVHESSDESSDGVLQTTDYVDGLARVYRTETEGGTTIDFRFDGASAMTSATSLPSRGSPHGWTESTFDAANRTTEVRLPDGRRRRMAYGIGTVTSTDERGARKVAHSDGHGRVTAIEEILRDCLVDNEEACPAEHFLTTYGYDGLDRLRWIRDQHGNWTTSQWDSVGRRREHCSPDGGCVTVEYHADGLPHLERDADGWRTMEYDRVGREVLRTSYDKGGTKTRRVGWTWDLDPATGLPAGASIGRMTFEADEGAISQSRAMTWSVSGEAATERRCVDGVCVETAYEHDVAGRMKRVTYPDGAGAISSRSEVVEYRYDDEGRLAQVPGYVDAVRYDLFGGEELLELANGVVEKRLRDPLRGWTNRITAESQHGKLYAVEVGHDPSGNVNGLAVTGVGYASDDRYVHDDLGRMRSVTSTMPGETVSFEYDAIGNVIADSRRGLVAHDDPRHVHAATSYQSGEVLTYDAMGQLVRDKTRELRWTPDGELAEVYDTVAKTAVQYAYDANGERTRVASGNGTLLSFGQLVEYDPAYGVVTYVMALGRVIARRDSAGLEFLHRDAKGSVRAVTDHRGDLVAETDYDAWGRVRYEDGAARTQIGFVAGETDNDTRLVYLGARYLDPELTQMISPDSIIPDPYTPQLLNPYAFVMNDPASLTDPSGHWPWDPDEPAPEDPQPITITDNYTLDVEGPEEAAAALDRATVQAMLNARFAAEDPLASLSPESREGWETTLNKDSNLEYLHLGVVLPLTYGLRRLSILDPTPITELAADEIDEMQGWGDTCDLVGGRGAMTVAQVLAPSSIFGKTKAAKIPSTLRNLRKADALRRAAKWRGVLKIEISAKAFTAAEQKLINAKYKKANKILKEGLIVARLGATKQTYQSRLSQMFVKFFEGSKKPIASQKVPKGLNVDEFLSRFFGGPQQLPNQGYMPKEINQRLGSLEYSAVRKAWANGATTESVLERIEIVWTK
jgi:RHS repeat-associated protein